MQNTQCTLGLSEQDSLFSPSQDHLPRTILLFRTKTVQGRTFGKSVSLCEQDNRIRDDDHPHMSIAGDDEQRPCTLARTELEKASTSVTVTNPGKAA